MKSLPAAIGLVLLAATQAPDRPVWPAYAADAAATHYSPLADITPQNVASLEVAWEWASGEQPKPEFGVQPGNFQNTPILIDDLLYVSTPYNRVVALEPLQHRHRHS